MRGFGIYSVFERRVSGPGCLMMVFRIKFKELDLGFGGLLQEKIGHWHTARQPEKLERQPSRQDSPLHDSEQGLHDTMLLQKLSATSSFELAPVFSKFG